MIDSIIIILHELCIFPEDFNIESESLTFGKMNILDEIQGTFKEEPRPAVWRGMFGTRVEILE